MDENWYASRFVRDILVQRSRLSPEVQGSGLRTNSGSGLRVYKFSSNASKCSAGNRGGMLL